jgi:hypothetical protein
VASSLYLCLSVCLSIYLPIYLSIYLSVCISIYLSVALEPLLVLGRFFSSLILYTVCRTPWTGDQPVERPQPTHRTTQTQNKRTQTSITWVGFEPTIPAFERGKTVHAPDRAATAIGWTVAQLHKNIPPLFMEPEGSLSSPLRAATGPYTEPVQCSPHPIRNILICLVMVYFTTLVAAESIQCRMEG